MPEGFPLYAQCVPSDQAIYPVVIQCQRIHGLAVVAWSVVASVLRIVHPPVSYNVHVLNLDQKARRHQFGHRPHVKTRHSHHLPDVAYSPVAIGLEAKAVIERLGFRPEIGERIRAAHRRRETRSLSRHAHTIPSQAARRVSINGAVCG